VSARDATSDHLRAGQAALTQADWDTARAAFEKACESEESGEALDGLGRALHFQGEYARAIELTERAFGEYRRAGQSVAAADCARWLAFLHAAINANMAAAGGWMARAESLLEDTEECAGHGWLALDRAPFTEDAVERQQLAAAALAIARRYGDVDLEYDAMALLGEAYVAGGRVADGMKLIDQAMTAVSIGEVVGVVAVSDILCRLLGACETAMDLARAEQWMSLAGRFEAWNDFVSPVCRNHYGGILLAVGRLADAEAELLAAVRTFERSYRLMLTSPLVKLADLRARQGRFEEAKRLLEGHEAHPVARRTLATVALARGEAELAEELVRLCLDDAGDLDPGCAPALELLVQIRIARGDLGAATRALDQLAQLAAASADARASAFAELAAGRLHAAEDDERASTHLQAAIRSFAACDLQLESARAQLELARALAPRAPDAAEGEARAALRAFERIGAAADADAAGGLLRELGGSGRAWPKRYGALTKRETEVLALLGNGCSNAEIAERLYISRRTAEHHVAHILSKLDLRSRSEAAAYAIRELPEDP
jgi:DNA-binding CsgD family transcriptional regulator